MQFLMHKAGWIAAATLALFVLASVARDASSGPIDPPQGVGSTYKTLQEVEPRIPIGQPASFPISLLQPGSYYLTSNITATAGSYGIIIAASNVTLDLNGFTLAGVPATEAGIIVGSAQNNIVVRNGTITSFASDGVDATLASNVRLEDLRVISNGGDGIITGVSSSITNCLVRANLGTGVHAGARALVTNCTAEANGSHGIELEIGSTVAGCTVSGNGGDGVNAGAVNVLVERCTAADNAGDGISVHSQSAAIDNIAHGNGSGVADGAGVRGTGQDMRIEGNHVVGNDSGINTGNLPALIAGNTARGNTTEFAATGGFLGTVVTTANDMNAAPNALINIDH